MAVIDFEKFKKKDEAAPSSPLSRPGKRRRPSRNSIRRKTGASGL